MAIAPKQESPRNKQLHEQITQAQKLLDSVAVTDVPRMSERIFVGIWLPFFAGDTPLPHQVEMTHWINFAGNPYRIVHVVNSEGAVLFDVPAIFDRLAINPHAMAERDLPNISHVVASAEQYAHVHPLHGTRYLDAELTKRALIMKVPATVLANLQVWNAIFARYGRPPLVAVDETTSGSESAQPDDGLSYDIDPL